MQKFSLLQAFSTLRSCRFTRRRQTLQHTLIPQSSMRRQTMQQCCDHSYCRLMQNCSCTLSPSDLQRCFCSASRRPRRHREPRAPRFRPARTLSRAAPRRARLRGSAPPGPTPRPAAAPRPSERRRPPAARRGPAGTAEDRPRAGGQGPARRRRRWSWWPAATSRSSSASPRGPESPGRLPPILPTMPTPLPCLQ